MKLASILVQDGKRSVLPQELAELLARRYGTEAEFFFSAIFSTGEWSVYLRETNGRQVHVVGTFGPNGYQIEEST